MKIREGYTKALRRFLLILSFALPLFGQLTPEQKRLNIASFEKIWTTIRDKHWDDSFASAQWQKVHDRYEPQVEAAPNMTVARKAMTDMIAEVHLTHFGLIPDEVYESLGDGNDAHPTRGEGEPGFDVRVVNGTALVTQIEPNSPAAAQHIQPGWEVRAINGVELRPMIAKLTAEFANSTLQQLMLARAVEARLSGSVSQPVRVRFADASEKIIEREIPRAMPRGEMTGFGNLPAMHVWYDTRRVGHSGYFGFNMFLDPARIVPAFETAVRACGDCDGFIVDLRGNPGGIGIMAMGIAGFFIDAPDDRLGVMKMRNLALKFVINPRPPVFHGPLAVLVDGLSASTSEIFAGGLQDLHRARVFGSKTAGAALPSIIERLPNGDAFQYAVANYISEGGETLEGHGVQPDVKADWDRNALLAGHDPALDAALAWIHTQKEKHD